MENDEKKALVVFNPEKQRALEPYNGGTQNRKWVVYRCTEQVSPFVFSVFDGEEGAGVVNLDKSQILTESSTKFKCDLRFPVCSKMFLCESEFMRNSALQNPSGDGRYFFNLLHNCSKAVNVDVIAERTANAFEEYAGALVNELMNTLDSRTEALENPVEFIINTFIVRLAHKKLLRDALSRMPKSLKIKSISIQGAFDVDSLNEYNKKSRYERRNQQYPKGIDRSFFLSFKFKTSKTTVARRSQTLRLFVKRFCWAFSNALLDRVRARQYLLSADTMFHDVAQLFYMGTNEVLRNIDVENIHSYGIAHEFNKDDTESRAYALDQLYVPFHSWDRAAFAAISYLELSTMFPFTDNYGSPFTQMIYSVAKGDIKDAVEQWAKNKTQENGEQNEQSEQGTQGADGQSEQGTQGADGQSEQGTQGADGQSEQGADLQPSYVDFCKLKNDAICKMRDLKTSTDSSFFGKKQGMGNSYYMAKFNMFEKIADHIKSASFESEAGVGGKFAGNGSSLDSVYPYAFDLAQFGLKSNKDTACLIQTLRLFGRLSGVSSLGFADASRHGTGESVTIKNGSNLARISPSELTYWVDDDLDVKIDLEIAEETLPILVRDGVDDVGNGPVILLVDRSGSTSNKVSIDGSSIPLCALLSALTTAFATKLLYRLRRNVAIVEFNSSILSSNVFVPTMNESFLSTQLTKYLLNPISSGGTAFSSALAHASKIYKTDKRFEYCDVVFLSDGFSEFFGAPFVHETPYADSKNVKAQFKRKTELLYNCGCDDSPVEFAEKVRLYGMFFQDGELPPESTNRINHDDLFDWHSFCNMATENLVDYLKRSVSGIIGAARKRYRD